MKKRIISLLLAMTMPLAMMSGCSGEKNFITIENGQITDGKGNQIWLKGIAMGNDVWSNPTEPVLTSQIEDSYRDISEMGFNSVRFYMNYQLFEDDSNPYTYKETGFDWINTNIEWAKKYGIGIILNMHVPQGGYQSQGNGTGLWTDEECRSRLIALWTEFAKRYANEDTIIGYGILNEPIVPNIGDVKTSVAQCKDLMQQITDSIRTKDKNHLIFAERVCAVQNMNTGASDWNIPTSEAQFLLDDDKTVYEFHCYDPHSFTHQGMSWANTAGSVKYYPSDEVVVSNMVTDWAGCNSSSVVGELDNGWEEYQSDAAVLSDSYNIGSITLRAANTGSDGEVLFDDVILEEYKDGELSQTINSLTFDDNAGAFYFWSDNGNGKTLFSSEGYSGGCVSISGTTSDANISGYKFQLKEGYEYKVKAKVKKINTEADVSVRIDYALAENIMTLNAEYLEATIKPIVAFGEENNVPMYLGEFGAAVTACQDGRGGEQWTSDMIDICRKYNLHFSYHTYHETTFGLYQNSAKSEPSRKNEKLAEVFTSQLKESK